MGLNYKTQVRYAKCDCGEYEEYDKDIEPVKFGNTGRAFVVECLKCKTPVHIQFKPRKVRLQSKLQKVATARNYLSFVLAGFYKPVNETYMTEAELVCWNDIKESVERMRAIHKKGNKFFGLKN